MLPSLLVGSTGREKSAGQGDSVDPNFTLSLSLPSRRTGGLSPRGIMTHSAMAPSLHLAPHLPRALSLDGRPGAWRDLAAGVTSGGSDGPVLPSRGAWGTSANNGADSANSPSSRGSHTSWGTLQTSGHSLGSTLGSVLSSSPTRSAASRTRSRMQIKRPAALSLPAHLPPDGDAGDGSSRSSTPCSSRTLGALTVDGDNNDLGLRLGPEGDPQLWGTDEVQAWLSSMSLPLSPLAGIDGPGLLALANPPPSPDTASSTGDATSKAAEQRSDSKSKKMKPGLGRLRPFLARRVRYEAGRLAKRLGKGRFKEQHHNQQPSEQTDLSRAPEPPRLNRQASSHTTLGSTLSSTSSNNDAGDDSLFGTMSSRGSSLASAPAASAIQRPRSIVVEPNDTWGAIGDGASPSSASTVESSLDATSPLNSPLPSPLAAAADPAWPASMVASSSSVRGSRSQARRIEMAPSGASPRVSMRGGNLDAKLDAGRKASSSNTMTPLRATAPTGVSTMTSLKQHSQREPLEVKKKRIAEGKKSQRTIILDSESNSSGVSSSVTKKDHRPSRAIRGLPAHPPYSVAAAAAAALEAQAKVIHTGSPVAVAMQGTLLRRKTSTLSVKTGGEEDSSEFSDGGTFSFREWRIDQDGELSKNCKVTQQRTS